MVAQWRRILFGKVLRFVLLPGLLMVTAVNLLLLFSALRLRLQRALVYNSVITASTSQHDAQGGGGTAMEFLPMIYRPADPAKVARSREAMEWYAKHLAYLDRFRMRELIELDRDKARGVMAAKTLPPGLIALPDAAVRTVGRGSPLEVSHNPRGTLAPVPTHDPGVNSPSVPVPEHAAKPSKRQNGQRVLEILNIPETAAESVITYLRLLLGCKPCSCSEYRKCLRECPRLLNQCGHSPASQTKSAGRPPPASVTMLRLPAERLMRTFQKARKHMHPRYGCCGLPRSVAGIFKAGDHGDVSPLQFSAAPGVSNAMTRMLAGYPSTNAAVNVTDTMYTKAVSNLESTAFFGIAECLEESLMLLRHTLVTGGILTDVGSTKFLLQQVAMAVRGAPPAARSVQDAAVGSQLALVDNYDTMLYRRALALFTTRLKKLGGHSCHVAM